MNYLQLNSRVFYFSVPKQNISKTASYVDVFKDSDYFKRVAKHVNHVDVLETDDSYDFIVYLNKPLRYAQEHQIGEKFISTDNQVYEIVSEDPATNTITVKDTQTGTNVRTLEPSKFKEEFRKVEAAGEEQGLFEFNEIPEEEMISTPTLQPKPKSRGPLTTEDVVTKYPDIVDKLKNKQTISVKNSENQAIVDYLLDKAYKVLYSDDSNKRYRVFAYLKAAMSISELRNPLTDYIAVDDNDNVSLSQPIPYIGPSIFREIINFYSTFDFDAASNKDTIDLDLYADDLNI